jgi:hypothetical protein
MVVEDMMKGNELAKKAWPEYGMSEDISQEARNIISSGVGYRWGIR